MSSQPGLSPETSPLIAMLGSLSWKAELSASIIATRLSGTTLRHNILRLTLSSGDMSGEVSGVHTLHTCQKSDILPSRGAHADIVW
jgi:hypothetical protein